MKPILLNYTSIKSIFPYITVPRTEWDENLAMEYAAQAYDIALGIKSATYDVKVDLIEIDNYKGKLPTGLRKIEAVVYMNDQPTEDEVKGRTETTDSETITENPVTDSTYDYNQAHVDRIQNQGIIANNYNIYTGLFSSTYNIKYYTILRPMDDPFTRQRHCTWCPNLQSNCEYTYSLTKDGEIITSIKSGYLCISYLSEPIDDEGNLLIMDDADVQNALAAYVMYKLWETKMHLHEQNAINIRNLYLDQWEKLAAKIKAKINIRQLDSAALAAYQHRFHNIVNAGKNWNDKYGIRT